MQLAKIIKFALGGGVVLISWATVGTAQAATFTDRVQFQAATTDLTTIDFEGLLPYPNTPFVNVYGDTIAGVTFSTPNPPIYPPENSNNLIVLNTIGTEYNKGTGDILLSGMGSGQINATFSSETTAFGVDILEVGRFNRPIPYRITFSTGEFFDITGPTFFGFTSAVPISSVSILSRANEVALDNFSFGQASSNTSSEPVPEPASILGTLAFAALGGKKLLKRKQQKTA